MCKIDHAVLRCHCSFCVLYPIAFLFCFDTQQTDSVIEELSTCQRQKWSLHDVTPVIIALHHSLLRFIVKHNFQSTEPLRDRNIFCAQQQQRKKRKRFVPYFSIFLSTPEEAFGCWNWGISIYFSPSHFNLCSALGAINRHHFILTLISQIHLHFPAAVTVAGQSELFRLYSSTYSGGLTGKAMGCFVERIGEPEVMHS